MICFLTSRIDDPNTSKLDPSNHFIDELRLHFPTPCRALDVCSNPDDWDAMDYYDSLTKKMFEDAGFSFERLRTLDGRNDNQERLLTLLIKDS